MTQRIDGDNTMKISRRAAPWVAAAGWQSCTRVGYSPAGIVVIWPMIVSERAGQTELLGKRTKYAEG